MFFFGNKADAGWAGGAGRARVHASGKRSNERTRSFARRACEEDARRPVSRVLSPAWRGGMAIHLGRPLPDASRDLPGRRRGNPPGSRSFERAARRPYLVLLPVGFTLPPPSPGARCALTAPFHPCPPTRLEALRRAVCFLWHFPWGRPRRVLPGTVFPWSPDFPPPAVGKTRTDGGHPAVWPFLPRFSPGRRQAARAGRGAARRSRRRPRR